MTKTDWTKEEVSVAAEFEANPIVKKMLIAYAEHIEADEIEASADGWKCIRCGDFVDVCPKCANELHENNTHSPNAADSGRVGDADEAFQAWAGKQSRQVREEPIVEIAFLAGFEAALAAQHQSAASPAGVPDGWTVKLSQLHDGYCVDSATTSTLVERGNNLYAFFRDLLAAAPSAPGGGEAE